MKHFDQDRMLREILDGRELSDLRRVSLEQGLASLRRRRQHRLVLRTCAVVFVPLLFLLVCLPRKSPVTPGRPVTYASLPHAPSPTPDVAAPIKFISDEELLALFPNRPVALIGRPGQQQLVFLDRAGAYRHSAQP
jgi:hypothetical protein